jgi:predicted ABC-type transport system involved in lysophospholipase L1 biosynthesis ATPase subunit
MSAQQQPGALSPREVIIEALARIETAYPALLFADERATEEAGEAFRRAVRIVEYQLRRDIPAPLTSAPRHLP